jgi:large subunit ribosomal protein L19
MSKLVEQVGREGCKKNVPDFDIGDTVDVHVRIREGDKERIQVFTGIVIAKRGSSVNASFTVRRIVQDEGVERVFPVHSPDVADIVVQRHGRVRRAKLYYLRDRLGRGRKLAERRKGRAAEVVVPGESAPAAPGSPPPAPAPKKPK